MKWSKWYFGNQIIVVIHIPNNYNCKFQNQEINVVAVKNGFLPSIKDMMWFSNESDSWKGLNLTYLFIAKYLLLLKMERNHLSISPNSHHFSFLMRLNPCSFSHPFHHPHNFVSPKPKIKMGLFWKARVRDYRCNINFHL